VQATRRAYKPELPWSPPTRNFPNRLGDATNVYLASAELAAVASILGKLPSVEEHMEYAKNIDSMAADLYRYLFFDQITEYKDAATNSRIPVVEMVSIPHWTLVWFAQLFLSHIPLSVDANAARASDAELVRLQRPGYGGSAVRNQHPVPVSRPSLENIPDETTILNFRRLL